MPCSKCGEEGHNRRTCTYVPWIGRRPVQESQENRILRLDNAIRQERHLRYRRQQERIRELRLRQGLAANPLNQQALDTVTARMVDVVVDPPSPKNKKPMRKLIADAYFVCSEETVECCICWSDVEQDSFRLSRCGHNYCSGCYENKLLTKCAICRDENM